MKRCGAVLLLFPFVLSLGAQGVPWDKTVEQLLHQALTLSIEARIVDQTQDINWTRSLTKLTVPGRTVVVSFYGDKARLKVRFTPYTGEEDEITLIAQSDVWLKGTEEESPPAYNSGLTSFPMIYGEEVFYFPLGREENQLDTGTVQVVMTIVATPYLSTLDEEEKASLFDTLEKTSVFHILEKRFLNQ